MYKSSFDPQGMSERALSAWTELEQITGQGLTVNSAHRDHEHNKRVGGAKNSQHVHGNAFDVSTKGMTQEQREALIRNARAAGFQGIGVYDNALHFDVGPERAWGPDYSRTSLPDWAADDVAYSGQATRPETPQAPQMDRLQLVNALAALRPKTSNLLDVRNFLT